MLHGRPGHVNKMMGGFAGIATRTVREVSDERITHHTYRYRNSIKATLIRPDTLQVAATAPHSAVLEKGSRPHRIVARNTSFLRFEIGSVVFYRRSVQHPGTKAYNILRDGVRRAGTQLNRLAVR